MGFWSVLDAPPEQAHPVFGYSEQNQGGDLYPNPTRQATISCSFPINADLKSRLEAVAHKTRISQREHLQRALRTYLNSVEQSADHQA